MSEQVDIEKLAREALDRLSNGHSKFDGWCDTCAECDKQIARTGALASEVLRLRAILAERSASEAARVMQPDTGCGG